MSEDAFLAAYDPDAYGRLALTVDVVLLGLREGRPAALLLKRDEHPQSGLWALPGGDARRGVDAPEGWIVPADGV